MTRGRIRRPPVGGPGSTIAGVLVFILAGLLAALALAYAIAPDECIPVGHTVCDTP